MMKVHKRLYNFYFSPSQVSMMEVTMVSRIKAILWVVICLLLVEISFVIFYLTRYMVISHDGQRYQTHVATVKKPEQFWHTPDTSTIPRSKEGMLIRYGRELIQHTSVYLGPKGSVRPLSNGMNCQNCHLEGGAKTFAANYSAVASTYPKFRHRSGTVEGLEKRVNDCFERSLNGKPLEKNSREMIAVIAYLKWLGQDVAPGEVPKGAGLKKLPLLNRAADPSKGKEYYQRYCSSCHAKNGEGVKAQNGLEWKYPPLWGDNSYNTGAGLYRISNFAAFIKANMPYGVRYNDPILSDEEAWDIAAYVNTMPRPHKNFASDWPDVSRKPIDHPFGPYHDTYSAAVHKYGPFQQILSGKEK